MEREKQTTHADRRDSILGAVVGVAFSLALFFAIGLAQLMSEAPGPSRDVDEVAMAYAAPEIVELEEEPPPPEEEEEPPPELEAEPPLLSLAQLDIALNPGTGGSLAGDFALPTIGSSAQDLGTEDFIDFSQLDQIPRPLGVTGFDFPSRLRKKKVRGQIVLLLKLDEEGNVLQADIDSSNLPRFDPYVLNQVKHWRFTPPTQQGRPVKARARLPIPINIT